MSDTGVGESITRVDTYIADYNQYKGNLLTLSIEYQNLYGVVQQQVAYAQQLELRVMFFYYVSNLVAIDANGAAAVMSAIADADASATPSDEGDTAWVPVWKGAWGIIQGITDVFLLKFTVLNYLQLRATVAQRNAAAGARRDAQIEARMGELAQDMGNKVPVLGQTRNVMLDLTEKTSAPVAPADDATESLRARAERDVGAPVERVVNNAEDLEADVEDGAFLTLNNCKLLPKAALSTVGAAFMWFIGDLVAGVISGNAAKEQVISDIDQLSKDASTIADGIESLEKSHQAVVDYINQTVGRLNALVEYLSQRAFPVNYVGPSWAQLSKWQASTSDGQLGSDTVSFVSNSGNSDWTGPTKVPFNKYQAGWQWAQPGTAPQAPGYAPYLAFADQAAIAYGFILKIKQWLANYSQASGTTAFQPIPAGTSATNACDSSSSSYNAAFAAFFSVSQSLFGGTATPLTPQVIVAGWNASLNYEYVVSDVQTTAGGGS